ncbi:MAG: S-methyl-5'-thioadenosine phosphorylase [Alphaproteobacteria bacterium]|nr:S-methyl-5'-thioadenosine phosphorylase [Alphaproteobacteria bacterium]
MGAQPVLGIIGGSGLYDIDGLEDARWITVDSPFGTPSDQLFTGTFDGLPMVFLPRHGRGHRIPPGEINYRANIDALKRAGVTDVVSLSACGSLRVELSPGTFVLVDQFIDRTFARNKSFFGTGLVAHVSMAEPVCGRLGGLIAKAAFKAHIPLHEGGTYLVMEGPQFSSKAESELYRQWGCDVIGMTNMPEAKLAREAELCYASIAMVTDYDCWHPDHGHVQVSDIIRVLGENADKARALIKALAAQMHGSSHPCGQGCDHVLDTALITAPDARDPEIITKLDAVAGRVLGGST